MAARGRGVATSAISSSPNPQRHARDPKAVLRLPKLPQRFSGIWCLGHVSGQAGAKLAFGAEHQSLQGCRTNPIFPNEISRPPKSEGTTQANANRERAFAWRAERWLWSALVPNSKNSIAIWAAPYQSVTKPFDLLLNLGLRQCALLLRGDIAPNARKDFWRNEPNFCEWNQWRSWAGRPYGKPAQFAQTGCDKDANSWTTPLFISARAFKERWDLGTQQLGSLTLCPVRANLWKRTWRVRVGSNLPRQQVPQPPKWDGFPVDVKLWRGARNKAAGAEIRI